MPPTWPQPVPAPAARSRRRWLLFGGTAVVVVVAALVVLVALTCAGGLDRPRIGADRTATASGPSSRPAPTTPPPAPLVPDEALPGVLLDTPALNAIMGTRELVVNPTLTTAKLYIDTTDHPECGGVWANANKGVYEGSGWEGV
jgi:hypothetical protein